MNNKELLIHLDNFYLSHLEKHGSDEDMRAYEQIKEMLSSPPNSEVTEEWIKEKTKMFIALTYRLTQHEPHLENHHFNKIEASKFIRKLIEEIK